MSMLAASLSTQQESTTLSAIWLSAADRVVINVAGRLKAKMSIMPLKRPFQLRPTGVHMQ